MPDVTWGDWLNAVWSLEVRPAEKLVLLCVFDHSGGDGACWPSLRRICDKTGLSESTTRRAMTSLHEQGLIRVEARYRDGRQTSNAIRLTPQVLAIPDSEGVTVTGGGCHGDTPEGVMVTPRGTSQMNSPPSGPLRAAFEQVVETHPRPCCTAASTGRTWFAFRDAAAAVGIDRLVQVVGEYARSSPGSRSPSLRHFLDEGWYDDRKLWERQEAGDRDAERQAVREAASKYEWDKETGS